MNRLAAWRTKLGMSQAELAAKVGATQGQISRVERGERGPGRRLALAIEEVTGGEVPASSWDDEPGQPPPKLTPRHA